MSVRDLRPNDVVALSVANPREPLRPLLGRGHKLAERVIRLLQQVGVRSVWIEAKGSEACDAMGNEDVLTAHRDLVNALGEAFAAAGKGDLAEDALVAFRQKALTLLKHLRSLGAQYIVLDDVSTEADDSRFHSANVCQLALLVAMELDRSGVHAFPEVEYAQLGMGALLHEIGKAGVPPEILNKEPWDLSQRELKETQSYTTKGFRLLRPRVGAIAANVALCHQLFLDGTGYPQEIEESGSHLPGGEPIHLFSRIVSLVKAYDALVTRQDYVPLEALEEINCARGPQFEPKVLQAFNRVVPVFALGSWVTLSTGHSGPVTGVDPDRPFLPRVLLLRDGEGRDLPEAQRLELALQDYPKARIRRVAGRSIEHLLPEALDAAWEDVA